MEKQISVKMLPLDSLHDCLISGITLEDAYVLGVGPFGFLGAHHYYMKRWFFAVAYTLTLGLFGVGWLVDLFTIPALVKRARERKFKDDG